MYEVGFYIRENIIDYTGNINSAPTVYFKKNNKFGRITQAHPNKANVGRNRVREATDYKITNGTIGKAEEYYDGAVRHRSRNPFITATWYEKFRLAKAIELFKDQKPK